MAHSFGSNDAEDAVTGTSVQGRGILGRSSDQVGTLGESEKFDGVWGESHAEGFSGVSGRNTHQKGGNGVWGSSDAGRGVAGFSKTWQGVYGFSESNAGVVGESEKFDGVWGHSHAEGFSGVSGRNTHQKGGNGVWGSSDAGRGVAGFSKTWQGVYGFSESNAGVVGESKDLDGIWGVSHSQQHAGVSGHNDAKGWAGYFEGTVEVSGDLTVRGDVLLPKADLAEEFLISDEAGVEPGSVVVIAEGGAIQVARKPYDRRVAGVVSGAGYYKPAIILDHSKQETAATIALVGKVYCRVDAAQEPIQVGDLLTTSNSAGHAMKASDPRRAFGAVLGKALQPLAEGRGLIPILVALT
jgi:hypothetical protein